MLKWFKENILDPIREGVDEAKQEMAEEEQKKNADYEVARQKILAIPYYEKFAVAIAAPFRAIYLSDWSPVLEDDESDGNITWPLSLYSFGEADSITDKERTELPELLSRDFDITDHKSAIDTITSLWYTASISDRLKEYADEESITIDESMEDMPDDESDDTIIDLPLKALTSCMLAYTITGSVDCGYLEKTFAMKLLTDVSAYVKEHFSGWEDFGEQFLAGERSVKLNNVFGRKMLKKFIGYLKMKPGSPWKNVTWDLA